MPMFSILIPTRDRLDLLKLAVASVLEQDFDDFELVISDNASNSDYRSYIYSLTDNRINYTRSTESMSVSKNWSSCLARASGQYIVMLGDDDALAPGALKRFSQLIGKHNNPEILYVMAYHYLYPGVDPHQPLGSFDKIVNSPLFTTRKRSYILDTEKARRFAEDIFHFRLNISLNAQHFIWRRDFVEKAEVFFRPPYPDYSAAIYTFHHSIRIAVAPEPLVIIGISKQSFGYFFLNNKQAEGEIAFNNSDGEKKVERAEYISALNFPGSVHYRNWLLTLINVKDQIDASIVIDLDRYRQVQVIESISSFFIERSNIGEQQLKSYPAIRPYFDKTMEIFKSAVQETGRSDSYFITSIKGGLLDGMGLYFRAKIENIILDNHSDIMDAFDHLSKAEDHAWRDILSSHRLISESHAALADRNRSLSATEQSMRITLKALQNERTALSEALAEALAARKDASLELHRVLRENEIAKRSSVWRAAEKLRLLPKISTSTDVDLLSGQHDSLHEAEAAALSAAGFDAAFYFHAHADVVAAKIDPVDHYVRYGREEGRAISFRSPENFGRPSPLGNYRPIFSEPKLTADEARCVEEFSKIYYDKLDEGRGLHTVILSWMGHSMFKCPLDLWIYQELIFMHRFDLIIEVGTYQGGSTLFLAQMLDHIGNGRILSIDISDQFASLRPEHNRITYLTGSSLDPDVFNQVKSVATHKKNVLVILDGDHRCEHVFAEIELYCTLVSPGGYLIVEDTNVNGHPAFENHGPGPWEAVDRFLSLHTEFEADRSCERFLLTMNPRGYLRRRTSLPGPPSSTCHVDSDPVAA